MERIVELSFRHKLAHLGSCLTMFPLLEHIYATKAPGDLVVLSAGHAGVAQYVALERQGTGIDAVQLVAAFFLWSMEMPFGIYRLITHPLNVSGTRSVESLQQQLPLIKLLCIAHRCIPRSSALWYRPPSPPRRSCPCLTASAGTKACSTAASTRTSAPS